MKQCIVVVFDTPTYADRLDDIDSIKVPDIKEICDFDDRWKVFDKYLKEEYQDVDLCCSSQGLVYDEFSPYWVYGLILVK